MTDVARSRVTQWTGTSIDLPDPLLNWALSAPLR
jgi:hypothetical protein